MTEELRLSEREFKLFRQFIYDEVGIALAPHKISLVQGRLSKRLRQLGMTRFTEYYDYLQNDRGGEEIFQLVNAISTNVTSFFREPGQWDFLRENLQERLDAKKEKRLRIWSAACSSGEEPYSIAMFLKDTVPDFTRWDIRILATDISKKVLSKAVAGRYREKDVEGMPKKMLLSHFERIKGADGAVSYQIDDDLRNLVTFRMFNLVHGDFSLFRNSRFDIIFCRNVMIYFDGPTQKTLVGHYHDLLADRGWLFVGHSESLSWSQGMFRTLRPSIYEKL